MREEAYALNTDQLHEWMSEAMPDPDALCSQHLRLVQRAAFSQHPPSAAELVDATQEAEANHWWHILPNLMLAVTLVIGLAGTMLILQQVLQGESLRNLNNASIGLPANPSSFQVREFTKAATRSILEVYQGFGGAFSASLTGIAWTVVLTAFTFVFLRPAQARFASLLHRVTLEILLPKFVPRERGVFEQLIVAGQSISEMTEAAGTALRQIGDDMGARLLEMCSIIGTSVGQFTEQAAKSKEFSNNMDRSSRALGKTLEKLTEVFTQGGPFQLMADQMSRQSAQLVASTEHLKSTVQHIGDNYEGPLNAVQQNTRDIQQEVVTLRAEAGSVLSKVEGIFGALDAVRLHKVREAERFTVDATRQQAIETLLKGLLGSVDRQQAVFARWETWMGLMQSMTARTAEATEQNQQTAKTSQVSLEGLQAAIGAPPTDGNHRKISVHNISEAFEMMLSTVGRFEDGLTQNNATLSTLEALVREFKTFVERPHGYWMEQEEQKLAWLAEVARRLPDQPNGRGSDLQGGAKSDSIPFENPVAPNRPRNKTEIIY